MRTMIPGIAIDAASMRVLLLPDETDLPYPGALAERASGCQKLPERLRSDGRPSGSTARR
jgi:hypothetical protein